jgi:hypothetical protein
MIMKRLIACVLAAACLSAAPAHAIGIGIGAFGGMSYPVLQDDTGNGTLYGVRVPVNVVPFLSVEPYWSSSKLGDKVQNIGGIDFTRAGFDETAYGANLILATGGPLSFYPLAGIGKTTLKRPGLDTSYTTYNAGFGIGISAIPKLTIHIRGELQAVVDGQTTRKFGNATAGVSYSFISLP